MIFTWPRLLRAYFSMLLCFASLDRAELASVGARHWCERAGIDFMQSHRVRVLPLHLNAAFVTTRKKGFGAQINHMLFHQPESHELATTQLAGYFPLRA